MEEEKEEREEMISGKQGWEEDGTCQSWQHFLKGVVEDLGLHAGQGEHVTLRALMQPAIIIY